MNDRTELLLKEYQPVVAIMVYKAEREYYLESHDVNESGQIMSGKPLLQETVQEMVDVFFDERMSKAKISGMIPENMIYFSHSTGGNYKMLWYRKEEERVLHHAAALKIKTGIAYVPSLLYYVERNQLYLFSLKTNKRPLENTALFNAPFFNTADDGSICLGSAQVKKPKNLTYENLIKYWEDLFWLSEFTHVNGSEKVKSGDLKKTWKTLVGKNIPFPKTELISSKVTIKKLIA